MTKKAQGISINTIIIAAIALIVLVVLIAIFTGRIGNWGRGVDDATKGTICEDGDNNIGGTWRDVCEEGETARIGVFQDQSAHPGETCCKSHDDS